MGATNIKFMIRCSNTAISRIICCEHAAQRKLNRLTGKMRNSRMRKNHSRSIQQRNADCALHGLAKSCR